MREFEILPSEEEFNLLAKEYMMQRVREEILEPRSKAVNSEYDEETANANGEILAMLRKLYSIAPYSLRPLIRRIIALKQGLPHTMARYSLNSGFCALLDEVIEKENDHIENVGDIYEPRLLARELLALERMIALKIYCIGR